MRLVITSLELAKTENVLGKTREAEMESAELIAIESGESCRNLVGSERFAGSSVKHVVGDDFFSRLGFGQGFQAFQHTMSDNCHQVLWKIRLNNKLQVPKLVDRFQVNLVLALELIGGVAHHLDVGLAEQRKLELVGT